jgi:hypothetical protein
MYKMMLQAIKICGIRGSKVMSQKSRHSQVYPCAPDVQQICNWLGAAAKRIA